MNDFLRGTGYALLLGGILLIIINAILTPGYLAAFKQGEAIGRTSGIYLLRISAGLVNALLLVYGCVGLYLIQKDSSGTFGTVAFLVAFVGTSLLFAIEWSNLFVLRAVAQTSPETLSLLDKSPLVNMGFASGAGIFMFGWLLLSVSIWQANVLPRWPAVLILIGIILIPILGATRLGATGQAVGTVIFGLGFIGLGYSML